MRIILFLLSCIPFALGVLMLLDSETSTMSLNIVSNLFVIWAVLFVGACLIDAIIMAVNKLASEESIGKN